MLKPKRIRRRIAKKIPHDYLSSIFVMIHDTEDGSFVCMNIKDQRLNLTPLDIAILQAENLPQATGLRP